MGEVDADLYSSLIRSVDSSDDLIKRTGEQGTTNEIPIAGNKHHAIFGVFVQFNIFGLAVVFTSTAGSSLRKWNSKGQYHGRPQF
ncbi:hypothetical protein CRG98_048133 [Punica granatum]|uniref:Uncharacterized protein n=1 Tax=Punica granatum TaxID=22663 RepID=A0A2I0HJG7_PUNGR|nr:hypothetical protein CRG98_048133 [Punica granatum]